MRDVDLLRAAAERVVAGQAAVVTVTECQRAQRHRLAVGNVLVGHAAGSAQAQGFRADQRTEGQVARHYRSGAVVDTRAAQVDRIRGDRRRGAGGVVGQVVVARVSAGQSNTRDIDGGWHCVGIRAGKRTGRGIHRQSVAQEHAGESGCRRVQRRDAAAVVGLVGGGNAGHRADAGRGDRADVAVHLIGGTRIELVTVHRDTAATGAGGDDAQAIGGDGFGYADVLVGVSPRRTQHCRIAGQQSGDAVIALRQRGDIAGVVDPFDRSGQRHRKFRCQGVKQPVSGALAGCHAVGGVVLLVFRRQVAQCVQRGIGRPDLPDTGVLGRTGPDHQRVGADVVDEVRGADQGNVGRARYRNGLIQYQIATGGLQQHIAVGGCNAVDAANRTDRQGLVIGESKVAIQCGGQRGDSVGVGQRGVTRVTQ